MIQWDLSLHLNLENPKMDQGEVLRSLQMRIINFIESGETTDAERATETLRAGKQAAAEYNEADEWNHFLCAFKIRSITDKDDDNVSLNVGTGNDAVQDNSVAYLRRTLSLARARAFWEEHVSGNVSLTLITEIEDEGGRSRVTEDEAQALVRDLT